jgi:ABC-type uncharacterized transport system ATPase subunit
MERPYIECLTVRNFGCLQKVDLQLTPLHALIGPNDSGKSTVLRALRTLTTLAAGPLADADDSGRIAQGIGLNPGMYLEVTLEHRKWRVFMSPQHGLCEGMDQSQQSLNTNAGSQALRQAHRLRPGIAGSLLLRLEPDALRLSTELIQEGAPIRFGNALGFGLPAVYDALVTRDLPSYIALNNRLVELFPTIKSLALKNPSRGTKALGILLKDGTAVSADFMSEGMLYFLAYAVLPYLDPTAVILIEEPENGLHPARIHEVMRVLREISKKTQVIIATHSPLVINELQADEVTVLTRDPATGTQARLMKDTPNFAERSKVYALGELWVSYADGMLEQPLFAEPEAAPDPGEPVDWSESSDR